MGAVKISGTDTGHRGQARRRQVAAILLEPQPLPRSFAWTSLVDGLLAHQD